jgi:hypothetical protein
MDKVQKPSSNECYTPSSEPFRMYLNELVALITKPSSINKFGTKIRQPATVAQSV